jgi:hypothetical protein
MSALGFDANSSRLRCQLLSALMLTAPPPDHSSSACPSASGECCANGGLVLTDGVCMQNTCSLGIETMNVDVCMYVYIYTYT